MRKEFCVGITPYPPQCGGKIGISNERKIEAIELADFAKVYNKDINHFIK